MHNFYEQLIVTLKKIEMILISSIPLLGEIDRFLNWGRACL